MALKSRLTVTQGHWKRNHWVDHTRLTIRRLLDVEYYRDLETWVRGHSRSLKLVLFESLGAVSYSPSIVTMVVSVAVCEIFCVKEWRDLEHQVRVVQGHWKWRRSIDVCDFLLVRHCKYSSILYHFRVVVTLNNNIVTLKSGLEVTQSHWNRCHLQAWCGFLFAFYSNCGRICSRLWDIQCQRNWKNGVTLNTRLGVVQGHWKWRRSIDHIRLSIGPPL